MLRRRPLLRAAAVGGVAYMGAKAGTNKAMAANQAPAQEAPQPAPAPAPAAPAPGVAAAPDRIAQLQQLAQLHDSGALTDEEFAQEKARILA
ncbi:MAG: SHOCT domain-containing protein [Acidimicrobiales bacterium]